MSPKYLPFFALILSQGGMADTLTLIPTYPGSSVPNDSEGGYISLPAGGSYRLLQPVTGASLTPDPSRRGYLVRETRDSIPPMPSDDPDGSRTREWLLND